MGSVGTKVQTGSFLTFIQPKTVAIVRQFESRGGVANEIFVMCCNRKNWCHERCMTAAEAWPVLFVRGRFVFVKQKLLYFCQ